MADGCSIADAEFRGQFPCARYSSSVQSDTARQCLWLGWAGWQRASVTGWSLILSLAPAAGWGRRPDCWPGQPGTPGSNLGSLPGKASLRGGRQEGTGQVQLGGEAGIGKLRGVFACVAFQAVSCCLLRNGHLSHTLTVPCRPICRLRRGSMIGDVRRMMDDGLL